MRNPAIRIFIALIFFPFGMAAAQHGRAPSSGSCANHPCVTTYHNNNARNGLNPLETVLLANNFPSSFGASDSVSVDGIVYAQPLYVYGVAWAGSTSCPAGMLNMVYVATENNTVYAIDADSPYTVCQSVSLNKSGANPDTAIPVAALPLTGNPPSPCNNLTGSGTFGTVGVTGTPVIDAGHATLFVVSSHQGGASGSYTYTQRLNALDISTLSIVNTLDLPTYISAATPPGYPTFYVLNESQRAGLVLTDTGSTRASIYVSWGAFCDSNIPAGGSFGMVSEFVWDFSMSQFVTRTSNFYTQGQDTNSTKSSGGPAGVWMSGGAPAMDAGGNIYFAVGNGNFEGVKHPLNFGNSIVKLGGGLFGEEDYYTPNVWHYLNDGAPNVSCNPYPGGSCPPIDLSSGDWDLGSGGVVLLTPSSATNYGELVAGGKEGMFYVTFYCSSSTQCPTTNWNMLMGGLDGLASAGQGGYNTDTSSLYSSYACTPTATPLSPSPGNLAQCFYGVPVEAKKAESGERSTPAFWPGATPYLYTVGTTDVLKGYSFNPATGVFATPAGAIGTPPAIVGANFGYPGATPSISSNGTDFTSAVLWVLDTSAYNNPTNNRAVLTAYAAKPSGSKLNQLWTSGTTNGPGATKFMVPTVANGKVYIGGQRIGGCTSEACTGLLTIYHQ